jgi:hypothetical protein
VTKHLHAASDTHGDTAHLGPAFATYHRALTLLFENALLAVGRDLNLTALPYWDYNIEARSDQPSDSVIWTDEYFGPRQGNPNKCVPTAPRRTRHEHRTNTTAGRTRHTDTTQTSRSSGHRHTLRSHTATHRTSRARARRTRHHTPLAPATHRALLIGALDRPPTVHQRLDR